MCGVASTSNIIVVIENRSMRSCTWSGRWPLVLVLLLCLWLLLFLALLYGNTQMKIISSSFHSVRLIDLQFVVIENRSMRSCTWSGRWPLVLVLLLCLWLLLFLALLYGNTQMKIISSSFHSVRLIDLQFVFPWEKLQHPRQYCYTTL